RVPRITEARSSRVRYDPANASSAWPAGWYDATIEKVEDGVSKSSGNEMQTVTFTVYDTNGQQRDLTEYFVNSSNSLWKYKQLAIALGQGEAFQAGSFNAANHTGDRLTIELKIEEDPEYGDKNRAKAFRAVKKAGGAPRPQPASAPTG